MLFHSNIFTPGLGCLYHWRVGRNPNPNQVEMSLCSGGVRRSSALFITEQKEHSEYTDYTKVTNNSFRLNTHGLS